MTKYCNDSSYGNDGFTDSKTTLDPEDDAAHVAWGGQWRIPTHEETSELKRECTWTWTTRYGVNGYLVTSKKSGFEGTSIFLPAAGRRDASVLIEVGNECFYYSSSLHIYSNCAWKLGVSSDVSIYDTYDFRCRGRSVRPVCP